MQKHEFEIEFQAIVRTFGEKEYSPDRITEIWKGICDLKVEELKIITKLFIFTLPSNKAPLPAQFIDEARKIQGKKFKEESQAVAVDFWKGRTVDENEKHLQSLVGSKSVWEAVEKERLRSK